jgi:hypothetical protein
MILVGQGDLPVAPNILLHRERRISGPAAPRRWPGLGVGLSLEEDRPPGPAPHKARKSRRLTLHAPTEVGALPIVFNDTDLLSMPPWRGT